MLDGPDESYNYDNYYFNTGRASLHFCLTLLQNRLGKNLNVGMQSFNCTAISEAVIQSGNRVILFDNKLDDFSISLHDIKMHQDLDVLLLLHYQGIPNLEYQELATYCKDNEIILIEDCAHAIGSSINGVEVGTLGDFSMLSFAYDKPFTCYTGGELKVNNEIFKEMVDSAYLQLDSEDYHSSLSDLKKLKFLWHLTSKSNFLEHVDRARILEIGFKYLNSVTLLILVCRLPFFLRFVLKYFGAMPEEKISVQRLGPSKARVIELQKLNYNYDPEPAIKMKKHLGVTGEEHPHVAIYWNRYSILDESAEILNSMKHESIQCGNYNWSPPLHFLYTKEEVEHTSEFKNAEFCAKHILNIPLWHLKE